ncbi:MAG: hypothetical protein WC470_00870 [Candidatus Paceibacterota bacterium]
MADILSLIAVGIAVVGIVVVVIVVAFVAMLIAHDKFANWRINTDKVSENEK